MKNRAAVVVEDGRIEIQDWPMPKMGPEDILVEIKRVGICGSDIHLFEDHLLAGARPYNRHPFVLGHESAGVVVNVGEKVADFKIGDRVALEPSVACMKCEYCKSGRYNLCKDMDMMAAYPFHRAAMQNYVAHPAAFSYKLPDNVSFAEGALLEPMNVGMHAAKRGQVCNGQSVLVMGAGCIGLMTALSCRILGVTDITVIDLIENRLNFIKTIIPGVKTICSKDIDLVTVFKEQTNGQGADVVFETAGSPFTLKVAPFVTKRGGKIVTVGNIKGTVDFSFITINMNEIELITVFRYCNLYPMCIDAISSGNIDFSSVVTETFPLERVQEAFETAINEKERIFKVMIDMEQSGQS
ncbi:MAG: NAD(P)-dependent alcohol dehydrogenase [Oscillospiraceae bacterium]|nr:NAD(P)-dependent alcohol dehydrogenase [Oscillospiraceae bacterium]